MSETTIDWREIIEQAMMWLSGAGLIAWGGWQAWVKLRAGGTVEDEHSSDKPAPVGFIEHARLIVDTAPAATPAIRERYMLEGLTEAQVLRAECKRLAPTKQASGWEGAAEQAAKTSPKRGASK